jgi:hypothetical protein
MKVFCFFFSKKKRLPSLGQPGAAPHALAVETAVPVTSAIN